MDKEDSLKYLNSCTRANPGLLIFIVDQSEITSSLCEDGLSLAQKASDAVNRCVFYMGMRFTSGCTIKPSTYIAIITHGGKPDNTALLVCMDTIDKLLANPKRIEHQKTVIIFDKEPYEIDYDIPIQIESTSNGRPNLLDAFSCAINVIKSWQQRENYNETQIRDKNLDPVPIIVNIMHESIPCDNVLFSIVNKIKKTTLVDGNPLIVNCILSSDDKGEDLPPVNSAVESDIDKIASYIPKELVKEFKMSGFVDVDCNHKLILNRLGTHSDHLLENIIEAIWWRVNNWREPNDFR